MRNISNNLRYLRKNKKLTQQQFADTMEIKRSLVGAYEEDRAEPRYDLLKKFAEFYELSMDELINETINEKWKPKPKLDASGIRVLSISVDSEDRENIELVPVKASAGYLNGYSDPEFISELPKFRLPFLSQGTTYRAFELKGDSMLPLQPGSLIIGEYIENWTDVKIGDTYVFITKSDGIVYKRAGNKYKENKTIKLISDNQVYEPYPVQAEDILEIWKAKAYISTSFPEPSPEPTMESLTLMMAQMQKSIAQINKPKN
ncbi:XRE family transcriptional regulator [Arcticibacter eurypsychrophilus]|uniref:XRE family transcriptional regulator n=1 Tax=Arcticibacter eurypsychrophilus TaxID=1434752 RepID=UPI00084D46F4|nr:helix-turn-helix domain-containing protein [Arcticibacter eurypsychrophilus]